MDAVEKEIEQYNKSLNQFILPGTLMDCFEYHRKREMRKAALAFNDNELSWFLHMMNELRGVADRKEDFDLLFDPVMYMVDHPAWTAPPGLTIELPPLNTQVLPLAGAGSKFAKMAEDEVTRLRNLSDTYPDEALIGLASVAAAAYLDSETILSDRRTAIRYLAINTSAKLEDYWAKDDSLWNAAGKRIVKLPDITRELKDQILRDQMIVAESEVSEQDLVCYSEDQIKHFAFNPDQFLLSGKTRHMVLCGFCQNQVAHWIERIQQTEKRLLSERNGQFPQA
jgi:hypothetical protein